MLDNSFLKKQELKWLIVIFVIGQIMIMLGSYRSEKLICNFEKHTCKVERYTYFNTKEVETLVDPNDVKEIVTEKDYRARRHSRVKYHLVFLDNNGRSVQIFADKYKSYFKAKNKAEEIRRKFSEGTNIIEISR